MIPRIYNSMILLFFKYILHYSRNKYALTLSFDSSIELPLLYQDMLNFAGLPVFPLKWLKWNTVKQNLPKVYLMEKQEHRDRERRLTAQVSPYKSVNWPTWGLLAGTTLAVQQNRNCTQILHKGELLCMNAVIRRDKSSVISQPRHGSPDMAGWHLQKKSVWVGGWTWGERGHLSPILRNTVTSPDRIMC